MSAPGSSSEQLVGNTLCSYVHIKGQLLGKKYGRGYRCFTADGQLQLAAHGMRGSRPLQVCFSGGSFAPEVSLQLRRSFPLTGRIDIVDTAWAATIGSVTRSRTFYDADDRLLGRFDDAKTWKEHFGDSLVDVAGQILFGGGGDGSPGSSDRFVLSVADRIAGSLIRTRLPFFPDPPRRPRFPRVERLLQQLLPRNVGDALFARCPPGGWKLAIAEPAAALDRRLLWCAALMTIELSHW